MNPKTFPKRLDSKTGCLRITVPENLDLALEGLIRKVLREQPKTDDVYAFAANYFETLLRIRDKAGAEYTATQLCPFHDDEEAREMIVLAGTFPRQVPARLRGKSPAPLKAETKKETDKSDPEKLLKRSKHSNPEAEEKQATPDLIKKLPLLPQNQHLNDEKTADAGPDHEGTENVKEGGDEEEYLTSDPIKEFVEKELLTEGNSKERGGEGEALEASDRASLSPSARETQNAKAEGGAPTVSNAEEKKGADGEDDPGAEDVVGGVTPASEDGGRRKIDPEIRQTDETGVEAGDVAKDAEDKIGDAAQPEAEGERASQETQQKKQKEKEGETGKLRAEKEAQNKEAKGVEAPLPPLPPSPGAAEKQAQELVHKVSPGHSTEADISAEMEGGIVTQSAALSEVASPQEKGAAEVGGVQQTAEDKSETDAEPSTASPMKTDEESPETCSPVTNSYDSKPVENDDARAAETDKIQKSDGKEATESIARSDGEAQDAKTEAASGRTERRINNSETGSSRERAKDVEAAKEGGASFEEGGLHQTNGAESNKGTENQDTKANDPGKPDSKSTEEGAKLTSGSSEEAEHAAGQLQAGAEDSVAEPGEEKGTELSGKLDPGQEQFSQSHVTGPDKEAEPKRGNEEEKAGERKKLSEEEVKAKDQSLTERRESPSNQTSPEKEVPLQKAEDVQCTTEAPTEEDARQTPLAGIPSTTEGHKSEGQGDAKQEAPRDGSSPTNDAGRFTEPEETQEIATRETEDAPTAENEMASLANEELCSVVDINHLKRDGGNQEERTPGNTPREKSAPELQASPSPSRFPTAPNGETWTENRNHKLNFRHESEPEDATQGKAESEDLSSATAVQEPPKFETEQEKADSAEGSPAGSWEGFDPSSEGKQIIIVEEAETTNENAEESSPPGEIQIKTIQTHYYDALQVPETVIREYRMQEVFAPTIDGLLGAASPPPSTRDEVQESPADEQRSGRLSDDNAVPPTPKTSPTSDGHVSPYAEAAEAQSYIGAPYHPSHVSVDALLAVDGSDGDAQASDSDDLPHLTTPTSDVASNIAEPSLRAASETFLTNEKRFSSLDKEDIRFVTPTTEEGRKGEPEGRVIESSREIYGGGHEATLPSTAEPGPAPQTPAQTEATGVSTEGTEHVKEDGESPVGSSGGSSALSDGRAANAVSPIDSASEKLVSEPPPQGEDESVQDAARLPEHADLVQRRSAAGVESAEKESFHSLQKTQQRNVLESCPEEVPVGSRDDGRTATGEASYAETDSTTSSAMTEVKRADSARRDFAAARALSSARSLDLGKRNPLLRTMSLSTHRHGVADFEVWSTIERELEDAATKIQSKFRGYNTRKKLRREVAVQISTEESSKSSTPAEPDDADNRHRATGEFHDGIVLPDHPR